MLPHSLFIESGSCQWPQSSESAADCPRAEKKRERGREERERKTLYFPSFAFNNGLYDDGVMAERGGHKQIEQSM